MQLDILELQDFKKKKQEIEQNILQTANNIVNLEAYLTDIAKQIKKLEAHEKKLLNLIETAFLKTEKVKIINLTDHNDNNPNQTTSTNIYNTWPEDLKKTQNKCTTHKKELKNIQETLNHEIQEYDNLECNLLSLESEIKSKEIQWYELQLAKTNEEISNVEKAIFQIISKHDELKKILDNSSIKNKENSDLFIKNPKKLNDLRIENNEKMLKLSELEDKKSIINKILSDLKKGDSINFEDDFSSSEDEETEESNNTKINFPSTKKMFVIKEVSEDLESDNNYIKPNLHNDTNQITISNNFNDNNQQNDCSESNSLETMGNIPKSSNYSA